MKPLNDLLLVVDVQNDFIDGPLGSPQAREVLPNIVGRVHAYSVEEKPVIITQDTHDDNYLQTQEGIKLPVPHCIINTPGWKLNHHLDFLHTYPAARFIRKNKFGTAGLPALLKETYGIDNFNAPGPSGETTTPRLEILGLDTDCCVIANAIVVRTFCDNLRICINADCCAGTTPENHQAALNLMQLYQIEII